LGFKMSAHDECLFTKMVNGRMIHVVIFVDDFLMTASQGADLDSLEDSLRTKYKEITVTEGLVHDYLGMKFDFSTDGKVIISMPNYVQKVIEVSGLTSHSTTPANKNLFVNLSHSLLPQDEQDDMHSLIAKLLYLSTRCRPDIALAVNYLCSRVKKFTKCDKAKMSKVISYLNSTPTMGLTLECNARDVFVDAFIDASYGVHEDRKSQTGLSITVGKGSIVTKSVKQKINTKSSTESELVACSDALPAVHQIRNLLFELGIPVKGIIIRQDNQSTITMIKNNRPTSQRSRHIDIRYFFLRDQHQSMGVDIVYTPTADMIADVMTKPLFGNCFLKLRNSLMNCE
jgi:hypothetical protein